MSVKENSTAEGRVEGAVESIEMADETPLEVVGKKDVINPLKEPDSKDEATPDDKGVEPGSFDTVLTRIRPLANSLSRLGRRGTRTVGDLITGRREVRTQKAFEWLLRAVGVTVGVTGFVFPVFETGLTSFGGYLLNVVANLLIGFALFASAEVVQNIHEIHAKIASKPQTSGDDAGNSGV